MAEATRAESKKDLQPTMRLKTTGDNVDNAIKR